MAYNTNTRLLLQFDGASATTDTSSFARACSKTAEATINTGVSPHGTGNSLYCDGLSTSGLIGSINVDVPGTLFSSLANPILISLHYFVESSQDDSSDGLFYLLLQSPYATQTVKLMTADDGSVIVTNDARLFQSDQNTGNVYGTGWHHVYVYINENVIAVGIDGSEVIYESLVNEHILIDINDGASLVGAYFGDADWIPHYGGLDSIQLFEGTVPWTGGSYTVPGRPDDYAAIPSISGTGSAALGNVSSSCAAVLGPLPTINGVGETTLSDITTSASFSFGNIPYNSNTRLQLRFNESDGSTTTVDSSTFSRTTLFYGQARITSSKYKYGGGSLALGNPGGAVGHGYVRINSPAGLFSTAVNNKKIFDLFYAIDSAASGTQCLLSVTLSNGDEFTIFKESGYGAIATQYWERFNNVNTYLPVSIPTVYPYTQFHHIRVLVDGSTLRIGVNGTDYGSITRQGGTNIWRLSEVSEILIGSWPSANSSHAQYYADGYLDSLVILENDSSWTGGTYPVPSNEPEDPGALPDILGDGITTLADVTSTGTGTVDSATDITGVSAVVIDDVVSVSTGELTCTGVGEAHLSDVSGTGAGELLLSGVGTATVGVLSSGQASVSLAGAGDASTDVTSDGFAGILVHGAGATTLADVLSSGYANSVLFGEGASIVSMLSSGFGNVLVVGEGQTRLGDVKTHHTPGHDWHVSRFSVRTKRNEMRVKL